MRTTYFLISQFAGLFLLLSTILFAGCSEQSARAKAVDASIERGRIAIQHYGCTSCHQIGGLPGTRFESAAPLAGIAERAYIAGVLVNSPRSLARWIRNPPAVKPGTAMPALAIKDKEASDMAAYLYSLR